MPPKNTQVIKFPDSTVRFDDNGIVCSVAKKVPQQTIEEAKKMLEEFRKIIIGKKICLLSNSIDSAPVNKEMHCYVADILPETAKSVAIISRSALWINGSKFPIHQITTTNLVKIFCNEIELYK